MAHVMDSWIRPVYALGTVQILRLDLGHDMLLQMVYHTQVYHTDTLQRCNYSENFMTQ